MAIEIPLDSMSVAEKLQAIEAIWASLCTNPADVSSPEWHKEILEDRQKRLASGDATVSEWSGAKKRLQDLGR